MCVCHVVLFFTDCVNSCQACTIEYLPNTVTALNNPITVVLSLTTNMDTYTCT